MYNMESVVATVSGYHGSERFRLIKLISHSGASYVGTMNRATTHLVCWKFEGRKYELAQELGILIVNHRWVEECVKLGRRVPEQPYLSQSGEEVGPLQLDVPVVKERVNGRVSMQPPHQRDSCKVSERPKVDRGPELNRHFARTPWYLDESMISECSPSNKKFHDIYKKEGKRLNTTCSTSRRYKDTLLEHEDEEPFSTSTLLASKQRKSSTLPEPHSKGHRLVKKNIIDLDPEQGSSPISVSEQLDALTTQLNCSKRRKKKRLRHSLLSDDELDGCNADMNESPQEMAHIHAGSDSNAQRGVAPNPVECPSKDISSNPNEILKGKFSRIDETTDVSCVICYTNFCSTRGVLPCGHRFCFSCIQSWSDVMVSRGKASTCPLCKASFCSITKVDDASSSDQKIFSQTVPNSSSINDIVILHTETHAFYHQPEPNPVCGVCSFREPEDLLVKCNLCQVRCIHSYCLDPPLLPWTCIHCKDLQMMYRRSIL